jgi:phage antirepressor YoqD-like protein
VSETNDIGSQPLAGQLVPSTVEGEARIRDVDLATRLGFAQPRDVRKLIQRWLPDLTRMGVCATVAQTPGLAGGRPATEFYLNRKQAIFITAKSETAEATEITIQIIEAFDAYERGARASDPLAVLADPDALRGLLFDYAGRVKAQAEEIAFLAPKADALDRIAEADGSHCITDTAKLLQVRPKDLFAYLTQHSWIYRRMGSDHWCAYQAHIASGDMVHKVTTVLRPDGTEKTTEQVRVTPKGLAKLAKLMAPAVRLVPPAPVATLPGLCA